MTRTQLEAEYRLIPILLLTLLLSGCAVQKPVKVVPVTLLPPQYQCDLANNCELVQYYDPPQYTPLACWGHRVLFLWQRTEPQSCLPKCKAGERGQKEGCPK